MQLPHVLAFLTFFVLAFANSNDKTSTDGNKPYILNDEEYSTEENIPQKIDLSQVHLISDALQNHLEKLEEIYHYLPPAEAYFSSSWGNSGTSIKTIFSIIDRLFKVNPLSSYNAELQGNRTKLRTVKCKHLLLSNKVNNNAVEMINSTRLSDILKSDPNVTSDDTVGVCVVVFFYSKDCRFSLVAAPHFKLLAHLFPQIKMVAINSINDQWLNIIYNIIGIPAVMLFHNGNPIAKHVYAENTFHELSKFIILHTDLNPGDLRNIYFKELINAVNRVTPKVYKPDYTLWLAWVVIIFWMLYYAFTKYLWKKFLEYIQNMLFGNVEGEQ